MSKPINLWSVLWRSKNRLDGTSEHLLWEKPGRPAIFATRRETREWIEKEFGYIRHRADLRAEPHGWRMPIAVRIVITVRGEKP